MSLIVEKKGAVGWIVFNQPAKKNAINDAMWRGIPEAMQQFDADREVRCVAFRGAGTEAFASHAVNCDSDCDRHQITDLPNILNGVSPIRSRLVQDVRDGMPFDIVDHLHIAVSVTPTFSLFHEVRIYVLPELSQRG